MIDWTHWHNEPMLVGGVVLAGWIYALLAGPWRARIAPGEPFPRGRAVLFYTGLALFYLSVGSPLDQIGERFLFWVHMVQHLLLVYVVALMILIALPVWMVDWMLRPMLIRKCWFVLTRPVPAAAIYVGTLSLWHFPELYEWALRVKLAHIFQHLTFVAAAIVMWWPLFGPSRLVRPIAYGAQMLYVFCIGVLQTPLGAFLAYVKEPLYPTYAFAPRLMNLSPVDDQILGGAIMILSSMAISILLFAWCFFRWFQSEERASEHPLTAGEEPLPHDANPPLR